MYHEQLLVGRQPEHFASLRAHRDHSAVVFGERRLTWAELAESRPGRGARADVRGVFVDRAGPGCSDEGVVAWVL